MDWVNFCGAEWDVVISTCKPLGWDLKAWFAALGGGGLLTFFRNRIWSVLSRPFTRTHKTLHGETENVWGREDELKQLRDHFAMSQGHVVITGTGGIGKTVLAEAYAQNQQKAGRYHDWVLLPLGSETEMASAIGNIGNGLGVDTKDAKKFITQTYEKMRDSGKRWLVILDNADTDEEADLVNDDFLPDCKQIDFIITSQRREWPEKYKHIELGPLSEDDAVDLLKDKSGRDIDDELKTLAIDTLECLPLPITIAGADLHTQGIEIAGYADDFSQVLKNAPSNTKYKKSVYTAVILATKRLDPPERALLNLAAYMDASDIDAGHILRGVEGIKQKGYEKLPTLLHSLCQDKNALQRAFNKCAMHSLLSTAKWRDEDTYRIHRTTQLVLREAMSEKENIETIVLTARLAAAQINGNSQYDTDNWSLYHRLAPQVLALLPFAATTIGEDAKFVGYILNEIAVFLSYASDDQKSVLRLKKASVLVGLRMYGEQSGYYATALSNLATSQYELGKPALSEEHKELDKAAEQNYKAAISISEKIKGADLSLAHSHNNLAALYRRRGNYPASLSHYKTALRLYEDGGVVYHVLGTCHSNLGVLYIKWANIEPGTSKVEDFLEKAIIHQVTALKLTRKGLGEVHWSTAIDHNNLAEGYWIINDADTSLDHAVRAVSIAHIMRDEEKIPDDHPNLALFNGNLDRFLSETDRDPSEATALIEAEKPKIIAEHEKWLRQQSANSEPDA